MSLLNLAENLTRMSRAQLLVEPEACVNRRARQYYCARCEKLCPAGAITLSEPSVELDEERCTGCGACVPECPAGALRLSTFSPEHFLAALAGQAEAHIHCSASRERGAGIVIPCHKLLDKRLLAAALAEGSRSFYLHGLAQCTGCPSGNANEHIERVIRTLTKWFGKAAPTLIAAPVAAPSGERRYQDQPRSDRRGFLRRLGAQPLISMLPVQEDAELPAFDALPCNDQETLAQQPVAYRLALGQRLPRLPWAEGRRLPWHTRTVEERCNACLICAERCPTGALAGSDNGFERTLSFDPLLCSNCSVCVKVCPPQSIVPHILPAPEQLAAGRRMLMYRRLQACADCGRFFLPESPESTATSPGQASCPSCRNEQEMDDEWLAMLEA